MSDLKRQVAAYLAAAADETRSEEERHVALDRIHTIKSRGHYGHERMGIDKYTLGRARTAIGQSIYNKAVAEFQREERYIVIKRKHINQQDEADVRALLKDKGINTVECVVVESDWPEYETVWGMIANRVAKETE